MRPQQKPFVIEIKKTRRLRTKPLQMKASSGSLTKGQNADASPVLQREDRA